MMYGIWNDMQKQWQFGICEETPKKARQKLFKKIGYDSYKWRFEAKKLPQGHEFLSKAKEAKNGN